jgi:hypothetical protein
MSNAARRIIVRILLLLATCVATFGYTITKSFWFLLLSPAAVILLIVVYRRWRIPDSVKEDSRRKRERRGVFIQLSVMLVVLVGMLIYSILQDTTHNATGYLVLLVELSIMIALTVIQYVLETRSAFDASSNEESSSKHVENHD